ncbi:MAG: porin family protein [Thermoanaerobaculales bacterium]|nr:porin family protein [Thermoanaerobaculales bacterium]
MTSLGRACGFGWVFFLGMLVIGASGVVVAEDLCQGFEKEGLVTRLDGPHGVIDGTLASADDLRALIEGQNDAFSAVLAERGLAGITEALFHALAAGQVVETQLEKGDILEWMTTRKKGRVTSFGPVCMAANKTYEAFELEVKEEGLLEDKIHTFVVPRVCGNLALVSTRTVVKPLPPIPAPIVLLAIDRNCESGMIKVDPGGSSEGVRITMKTQDGIEKEVAPGEFEDLYRYSTPLIFTAVAENTSREGAVQRTEKTVTVDACPAPAPACNLTLSGGDLWVRDEFVVNADGHWAKDGLALRILDGKGDEVERLVPAPALPYTTSISKPGFYRVQGGATNEVGETAGCEAMVYVRPRWNVRAQAVNISPTDREQTFVLPGSDVRTVGFDSGLGAEVGLEYRATRRLGIEVGVMAGSVDSHLRRDVFGLNAADSDSLGLTTFIGALNFHLTKQPGVDFYLGPVVALMDVGDASFELLGDTVDFEGGSDFGWGGQIGIDVPLSRATAWGLHLGLRFLDIDLDDDADAGSVRLDPFIAGLGLSYGF